MQIVLTGSSKELRQIKVVCSSVCPYANSCVWQADLAENNFIAKHILNCRYRFAFLAKPRNTCFSSYPVCLFTFLFIYRLPGNSIGLRACTNFSTLSFVFLFCLGQQRRKSDNKHKGPNNVDGSG